MFTFIQSISVKASVILPTKDRGALIDQTIDSLLQLDFDPSEFEILLVDNCSSPENQQYLQKIQSTYSDQIRYVHEPKLGLSNARNCGIANAKGEILLFLDDDALVPSYWLANIVKYFDQEAQVYALGSKVIAKFTSPAPDWIDRRLGMYISNFDRGDQVEKLFYNEYPRGTNMAFRRTAFEKCGKFLDCFGRKGHSLMSYEEIELCYRLEQQGCEVIYVPDAEVFHLIRGDRLNESWFQKRFYWQGRSEGLFELIHFGRSHMFKNLPEHWRKSWQGDSYDQLFHRGFIMAMLLNLFRQDFS
jgi:glycosyltransferase involved in cell wall biosynthesis